MRALILSFIIIIYSNLVFAEGAEKYEYETAINPVLSTTLVELPTNYTVKKVIGSAQIGTRNTGNGLRELLVGNEINSSKIIFMLKKTKVILINKSNNQFILNTTDKNETFTFKIHE